VAYEEAEEVEGFRTVKFSKTKVVGLPEPVEGTWYIVPYSVFRELPERLDLLSTHHLRSCAEGTNLVVIEAFLRH